MRATSEQKVISRDSVPKAQEAYKDSNNIGFCFPSVLCSSRSYDDARRIYPRLFGHEQLRVCFCGDIDFILFETCHESHNFVRHKQRLSSLEFSSHFLPLTLLRGNSLLQMTIDLQQIMSFFWSFQAVAVGGTRDKPENVCVGTVDYATVVIVHV